MMRRHPLACCHLVLKHRKIDDPDGMEGLRAIQSISGTVRMRRFDDLFRDLESAMPVGVLLRQFGAEVARCRVDVDLALGEPALEFRIAGFDVMRGVAGHDDDEVSLGSSGELAHLDGSFRKALGEALEIVDELWAFLLIEERMIVFALL